MLIRNPAEFEHAARDWAVKYAGAPKKEVAEGSGGATQESLKRKNQQNKERDAKALLAAYVLSTAFLTLTDNTTATMVIIRTSSTASLLWDSM